MPAAGPFPVSAADDDGLPTPAPVVTPAEPAAAPPTERGPRRTPITRHRKANRTRVDSVELIRVLASSPLPQNGNPQTSQTLRRWAPAGDPPTPNASSRSPPNRSSPRAPPPMRRPTMAAVASTSGPAAKPRVTGKTLAPPPLACPLASILTPPAPATKPEISDRRRPRAFRRSAAAPFLTRPTTALAMTTKPKAELLGPTPPAGLPALGSAPSPSSVRRPRSRPRSRASAARRRPRANRRAILDLSQVRARRRRSRRSLAPARRAPRENDRGLRSMALRRRWWSPPSSGSDWKWWSARAGRIDSRRPRPARRSCSGAIPRCTTNRRVETAGPLHILGDARRFPARRPHD